MPNGVRSRSDFVCARALGRVVLFCFSLVAFLEWGKLNLELLQRSSELLGDGRPGLAFSVIRDRQGDLAATRGDGFQLSWRYQLFHESRIAKKRTSTDNHK